MSKRPTPRPAVPSLRAQPDTAQLQDLLPHWSRLLDLCQDQSEAAVSDMLQTLAQLTPYVAQQPAAAALLARLQESLQYQDRQRQMLELLAQDLLDAACLSEEMAERFTLDDWINRFDAHCPIPELRRSQTAKPLAQEGVGDAGLEYF